VRIDGRHGVMAARGGGITSMAELQLGIGGSFGFPEKRTVPPPPEPLPQQPEVDETDSDHDGLPDRIDKCPSERETVNGLLDGDGCPEPDADNDSIIGDADKCPDAPEDKDGFEDEDGCPDTDNDKDGILDAADKCPSEAETRNGFDDDDGCPDTIPPEVGKLLATASALRFESNRARVTDAAQKALAPLIELMLARKSLRVAITARPAKDKDADLAKRRAEAVKWYLVDQGIGEGRFTTRLAAPGKGTAVELTLILE
jgi:outer membrane protein OmpA-like peptidoglycan-associated protein